MSRLPGVAFVNVVNCRLIFYLTYSDSIIFSCSCTRSPMCCVSASCKDVVTSRISSAAMTHVYFLGRYQEDVSCDLAYWSVDRVEDRSLRLLLSTLPYTLNLPIDDLSFATY